MKISFDDLENVWLCLDQALFNGLDPDRIPGKDVSEAMDLLTEMMEGISERETRQKEG